MRWYTQNYHITLNSTSELSSSKIPAPPKEKLNKYNITDQRIIQKKYGHFNFWQSQKQL